MKTSQGKLAYLAFILILGWLLLMPMKSGQEDSLLLNPSRLKMSPGGSYKITCLLSSDNENQSVRFESSDPLVATISGDGTVNALSAGDVVITASASGGASAKCKIEVTGVPLNELAFNVSELHISKGQHSGLSITYNTDASDTRLQWVSEDPTVATVDDTGRVEGIKGGRTRIAVLAPNGKTAYCDVCVDVPSTAISITPNDMILGVGAKVSLNANFLPADSTDTVKSWVASNPNVLTISDDGVVTALAEGMVHVSALTEYGLTAGMEILVEAAPKDLELNPSRATITRGDTLDMQLLFMDKTGSMDATTHPVVWTSSDTSVASVDENGRVKALKSGVTRITASSDGRTVSGYITVRVYVQEISLEQTEVYLLKEDTNKPIQLKLTTTPKDADNADITFTSNNTQVADVTEEGLVMMTGGYGTAVITASAEGGATATFTVNVVTELPKATEEPVVQAATEEPIVTAEPEAEEEETSDADLDWGSDEEAEEDTSYASSGSSGELLYDEYGEIVYDEYGEPVYQ